MEIEVVGGRLWGRETKLVLSRLSPLEVVGWVSGLVISSMLDASLLFVDAL